MGISGLLPFVKNACRKGKICELKNQSVAVDVSCLLHKGLTGCMDKIHMGEDTQSYIRYVEKYINELLSFNCHVVMVFDGRPLPAKQETNDDRRQMRDKNLEQAALLLAKGMVREAREKYRLTTKISSEIVENTIKHFRTWKNVDIIVAPYEADAQLAYLMKAKLVDAVITEDSDLIVFGCEKIYFKWQPGGIDCTVYEKSLLPKVFTGELGGDKFDFIKFRRICILSGCDYLQAGLPGVGLSTAVKFFAKTSITDLPSLLKKIPSYLNNQKLKSKITKEFIEQFERAENTFLHQIVFDPKERCQKPLNPYPKVGGISEAESTNEDGVEGTQMEFAGVMTSQRMAVRLALGNKADGASLNDSFLAPASPPEWSIWCGSYESRGNIKKKLDQEKEAKSTICGAFKLDPTSSKKIKKKVFDLSMDDEDYIVKQFMEDVDKSEKKKTTKRKNEPEIDYSAEQMIAKYSIKKAKVEMMKLEDFDELFEKKETTSEKNVERIEKIEIKEENSKSPPKPKRSESAPAELTPKSIQIKKKFVSPMVSKSKSGPVDCTNTPTPIGPIKSRYFMKDKASPKVLNPFRIPAFIKTSNNENDRTDENVEMSHTEKEETTVEKCSTSIYRFVGFKASGLRKKSTK